MESGVYLLEVLEVSETLDALKVIGRELLCTLEAVEDELCLLEVTEVMGRGLLCMLEAMEGEVCLRC